MTAETADLRRRGSLKWTYYDEDVLAAWVAEMDFGLAPPIISALHDAVDRGVTGYPYPDLEAETAEAAVGFWAARFGWDTEPEWVFPVPDVVEGIRRAITHLTAPDSPVVIHSPVYFPFYGMVERAGRRIVEVACSRGDDKRYRLDLDGIERAFSDGAGSIVLCNPWNPTGRVFEKDEIQAVLDLAAGYGARVIADEIHAPITYGRHEFVPAVSVDAEVAVSVLSASKAWNLPGLKCAQVVLPNPDDRDRWSSYFTMDKVGVGTLGLVANTAAYTAGGPWLDSVLATLSDNRSLVTEMVAELLPEAVHIAPEGTYLSWMDLSAYAHDDPAAHLLDAARVAVTGGAPFGGDGSRHVRFNFASTTEIVSEAIERMASALKQ